MGFIYIPVRQEHLNKEQIIQIGNIRDKYFDSLIDRKFVEEVYWFAYNLFKNEKRVLDFGAGSGKFVEFLKRNNLEDNLELYGIDINPKYKKSNLYKSYQIMDGKSNLSFNTRFQFPNNYFDAIVGIYVFHYNVPKNSFKEIHRTMKDSGIFIFNLYLVDEEYKENLSSKLEEIGFDFNYKEEVFESKRIFKVIKHSPVKFYICDK